MITTPTTQKYDPELIGFKPSPYQEKLFDFITEGKGNVVISATAGSGKTTSIVAAMKLIPKTKKCIFIAFNKAIAEELGERLKDFPNCRARTGHSLGLRMVKNAFGNDVEIDEYKYRTYLKKNLADMSTVDASHMSRTDIDLYVETIETLISFGRLNIAQTEKDLKNVAAKYGIQLCYDEAEIALRCMDWGKNHTESIDYTDMIWLPVELGLSPVGCQYDWVFIDEAQDQSMVSIELFKKCFKRGTRFAAVGDKSQCINGFAGSCPEAFQYMCDLKNTIQLELPVSYRCAQSIVKLANEFVPSMQSREGAVIGEVKRNCRLKDVRSGDMILTRTKAPLFGIYVRLLKANVNCYIKGADIGQNLIKLLESIDISVLNRKLDADGVFVRLNDRMLQIRNKLMERRGLDIKDATLSTQVTEMYDTIEALNVLAEGLRTKEQLITKIKNVFREEDKSVCLSTVHKSKGLEANRVFIACESTMPSKRAELKWEIQQEYNLIYVAYTRAKTFLGFISEKDVPASGGAGLANEILDNVRYNENKVCKVLGREPLDIMTNDEIARFKIKSAKPLDSTEIYKENGITLRMRPIEESSQEPDDSNPTVKSFASNNTQSSLLADLEDFANL